MLTWYELCTLQDGLLCRQRSSAMQGRMAAQAPLVCARAASTAHTSTAISTWIAATWYIPPALNQLADLD